VALELRDPTGTVCGGFLGHAGLGWLNVSALWVAEARRDGLGRALVEAGRPGPSSSLRGQKGVGIGSVDAPVVCTPTAVVETCPPWKPLAAS
jgi:hypothetical protein